MLESIAALIFDTETARFGQGLMAPPMACVTWIRQGHEARIRHAWDSRVLFEDWLKGSELLVGHNVAYDMAVVAARWPDLIPAIFDKYDRDQITDTLIREQLLAIAHGVFKFSGEEGNKQRTKYSLADCYHRRTRVWLEKDEWRLRYGEFLEMPLKDWPAGAREYPLNDVRATLLVFNDQESERLHPDGSDLLADQFRQARAAFAFQLSRCWGITTDAVAVAAMETEIEGHFLDLQASLQALGIVRADGTADTKAAKAVMIQACKDIGRTPNRTKTGDISLAAEWCEEIAGEEDDERSEAQEAVALYSEFLTYRKIMSNDIEMLRQGLMHPEYGMAETGRSTCRKPNIQNVSTRAGIRECFRPRPGFVFAQADYEGVELHCLAQWVVSNRLDSAMADALNAGRDLHTDLAAGMLGIAYEEGIRRKKSGDKDFKGLRQAAKAVNFGLPGGLGHKRLGAYAWSNFGVRMTEAEARDYVQAWRARWPESGPFFQRAAEATANFDGLGSEWTLYSRRFGSAMRYTALCNRRFQGLAADITKLALWMVTRACYAEPTSPLYGCRVVAMVHDELILEVPADPAHADAAARELGRLMMLAGKEVLPDVPPRCEPMLMACWSKAAEPTYDKDTGRLVPWAPPANDAQPLAA